MLEGCNSSRCGIVPHYDCEGVANTRGEGWLAAVAADSLYINDSARRREDMAETWWAWFVSRCVPERLHPEFKRRIDAGIPNRLAFFDGLNLDMRPWGLLMSLDLGHQLPVLERVGVDVHGRRRLPFSQLAHQVSRELVRPSLLHPSRAPGSP